MTKIEEAMKLIGPGCICEVNLGNILLLTGALKEAIEQHEAFRQEVSDAVEVANMRAKELKRNTSYIVNHMQYFIITKPDPLVEVLSEAGYTYLEADKLRAALAKRGLEIREKSDD